MSQPSEPALMIHDGYPRLFTFFGLSYLYSWILWAPLVGASVGLIKWAPPSGLYLAGGFGPVIAAILLAGLKEGKQGIGDLVRRLFVWRVDLKWYGIALLLMPAMRLVSIAVHVALGGRTEFSATPWEKAPLLFLIGLIVPLAEEPGWRGFALPRLLSVETPVVASTVLGLVWAAWHLPMFWLQGTSYSLLRSELGLPLAVGLFAVSVVALSVLFTYLFLRTKGSLLIAFLFHDSVNTSSDLLFAAYARAAVLRPFWLFVGILVLTAVVIMITRSLPPRGIVARRQVA
jgi:membrane protease YdiL (CAAX protease family)